MLSAMLARQWRLSSRRGYQTRARAVFGYNPAVEQEEAAPAAATRRARQENARAFLLAQAYRQQGHQVAALNPVPLPGEESGPGEDLQPAAFGLAGEERVQTAGLIQVTLLFLVKLLHGSLLHLDAVNSG